MSQAKVTLAKSTSVILRKDSDGHATLYDASTEIFHVANPSGVVVWELCDGTRSPSDIKEEICARYQVSTDLLERVDAFLAYLIDPGLLHTVEVASSDAAGKGGAPSE